MKLFQKILRYGVDININFEDDLGTDAEEEEKEISDVGTVNPSWQDKPQ